VFDLSDIFDILCYIASDFKYVFPIPFTFVTFVQFHSPRHGTF